MRGLTGMEVVTEYRQTQMRARGRQQRRGQWAVGGIYSGTMETMAEGEDVTYMQGDKGQRRTSKGGVYDEMTER